jgi:hypothetical protein
MSKPNTPVLGVIVYIVIQSIWGATGLMRRGCADYNSPAAGALGGAGGSTSTTRQPVAPIRPGRFKWLDIASYQTPRKCGGWIGFCLPFISAIRLSAAIHDSASASDVKPVAVWIISPGRLISILKPSPSGMIRYVASVMVAY